MLLLLDPIVGSVVVGLHFFASVELITANLPVPTADTKEYHCCEQCSMALSRGSGSHLASLVQSAVP